MLDEIGFRRVVQRPDRTSVFAQYTVLCPNREAVQASFKKEGIPTAVHYHVPLNEQPAYAAFCRSGNVSQVKQAAQQVMSLPMDAYLNHEDQQQIVAALRSVAQ